jgi:hypothetical protein
MKYIKYFENKNFDVEENKYIQIGHYVIASLMDDYDDDDEFMIDYGNFLENNIGEVISKDKHKSIIIYTVKYDDMDEYFEEEFGNPTTIPHYEIIFSSSNKKDCETYLKSKKYNI